MVNLEEINREVIAIMKRHYGDRLAKIVLFGSYARGDFDEESDIDYLIVLKDSEVSTPREIHQLSPPDE
ncbi:nucleotidyltransferase domain-containing protein [Tellurirhabdus rosea]|uniref:nucleotidyltransferase domain-containing protein n=1 Tax=Tellurirhabdus rosea TaxID=2674997 RepID=UPI002254EC5A|nr:nucleotidyltransferase domain-containing protein [Tellurirhabdus rosea]